MKLNAKTVTKVLSSIRAPEGYSIDINAIIPHGDGIVVTFTETATDGRVAHRCAGYDEELRQRFDTIISNKRVS